MSEHHATLKFLQVVEDFCSMSTGPFKAKYPDYDSYEGALYLKRKAAALKARIRTPTLTPEAPPNE